MTTPRRSLALAGLLLSLVLLVPGLVLPVITIKGQLDPKAVATLAPKLLDQGLSDADVEALKPVLNPMLLPLLEASPGGLKAALVNQLGSKLGSRLSSGPPIEVYQQTRSILSAVRHLYQVHSPTPATLILLFSVLVPFTKAMLVLWAVTHHSPETRRRTLHFVELIAKWSMADVFAVALFITYLAAKASQSAPGAGSVPSLVNFTASFGPGFYWFAAYCLVSLGTQQATARWLMASPERA